jgi:hypothetical protein
MEQREKKERQILKEGEEKRRRTSEKRYKEKVNKKIDEQRKRKPEKNHKGESGYAKSTNGGYKGQKEKRKRKELPGE